MLANHADNYYLCRGIRVDVKRGQVGHSETTLASRWKWSRTKIRAFLKELEKEQQIEQQKTNVTTLITLVNYSNYQDLSTAKETPEKQQKNINNNENNDNNKTYTPQSEIKKLSTGIKSPIEIGFYPDDMTIEYALSRRLPDPTNQSTLDEFINNNLSSNWTSANWQAEYRKFLPKWKLRNEQTAPRKNQAEKMYEAICNLPDD